jgi:hypothetical protein
MKVPGRSGKACGRATAGYGERVSRASRRKPIFIAGVVLLIFGALFGLDRIRGHSELPTSWEPHGMERLRRAAKGGDNFPT